MGQTRVIGRTHTKILRGETTTVRYHQTDVVQFDARKIVLNTGGWRTVTTKARMNQASNQFGLGFYVSQRDFAWTVHFQDCAIPFDGRELVLVR